MSLERRENSTPDSRLDALYHIVNDQATVAARLLVTSEQQQKSLETIHKWIDDHDAKYHKMDVEFNMLKSSVNNWSTQFGDMKDQVRNLVSAIQDITSTGLKVQGGWITITMIATLIMAALTIAKTFGLF